jgi:hypothetical protein
MRFLPGGFQTPGYGEIITGWPKLANKKGRGKA